MLKILSHDCGPLNLGKCCSLVHLLIDSLTCFGVKIVVNLLVIFKFSYTLALNPKGWIWSVCYDEKLLKLVTLGAAYERVPAYLKLQSLK